MPKNTKDIYYKLLRNRRSQRIFNSTPVTKINMEYLLNSLVESPSSCNRQAVSIKIIDDRSEKDILSGLLVGGVGWCHRADKIILLFAHKEAYKEKLDYMPFLDAGIIIFNTYLACEAIGLGCCFINPNIRENNIEFFKNRFGKEIFCGAIAVGNYDKKSKYTLKIKKEEILL